MSFSTGNSHNNELSVGYTSIKGATSALLVGSIPTNTNDNTHLCREDDYTNDLPIFIQKQTICNVESVPVDVYEIKYIEPAVDPSKPNYVHMPCIKG